MKNLNGVYVNGGKDFFEVGKHRDGRWLGYVNGQAVKVYRLKREMMAAYNKAINTGSYEEDGE